MSDYNLEINTHGAEAVGYEDHPRGFVSYGYIWAEGNCLAELIETAEVELIDQDGGGAGMVPAQEPWMLHLIGAEYVSKACRCPDDSGSCEACLELYHLQCELKGSK